MQKVSLQGISKRLFPGCVKLVEKVAFCLPAAGRETQFFHFTFTKPGKSLLEIPCILQVTNTPAVQKALLSTLLLLEEIEELLDTEEK